MSGGEKITDGCLCGAVRYESSEPPSDSNYCHCRMCQRTSGAWIGYYVRRIFLSFNWKITNAPIQRLKDLDAT